MIEHNYKEKLQLFKEYIIDFVYSYITPQNKQKILNNGSLLLGFTMCSYMMGLYFNTIYIINKAILFFIYWFSIGVLSTIGFGFGLQTGVLFLFPYIINNYDDTSNYAFVKCYTECLPAIFFWGIGTAFGELPPYIVAKSNRLSNDNKNDTFDLIEKHFFYKKLKNCLQTYKFITIVLFASWPNLTFDMCGMLCGYYDFKIHEFLIPTIIGKSIIKAPIQSFVVLYIYSNNINYNLKKNNGLILTLWNIFMLGLILYFIKNTIENIASIQFRKNEKMKK